MSRVLARIFPLIELLRPRQWIKNAFVLVGPVFGHAWRDPVMLNAALCTTLAFCLASGAVYALNDARDAERDREHPDKRARPVARGALSQGEATALSAAVAAAALALAAWAGWRAAALVAAYLCLSAAYSVWLKHLPVLDVAAIAAGFMLRLLAGTLGVGIEPSNWLLACGFLLTLFLGFAKRRAEIARLAQDAGRHRAVLADYSIGFLDKAITLCAAGMIAAYAWYTLAAETALIHGTGSFALTLPWVLLGTARYLYCLRLRGGGGSGRGNPARPAAGGLGRRLGRDRTLADRLESKAAMAQPAAQLSHLEHLGDATKFSPQIHALIPKCNLLENFSPAEVRLLAHFMDVYQAALGAEIIREGDGGDFMLMLIEGKVEVHKRDRWKTSQLIAVVEAGKTLGEMSMIDGEPRFATCIAAEPTVFAVLDRENLARIIVEQPMLGAKILMELVLMLSQRLRSTSARLLQLIDEQSHRATNLL